MATLRPLSVARNFALALGVLVSVVACGGGGDDSSKSETVVRSSAQSQCDSLMGVWCQSALDCVLSGLAAEEMPSADEVARQRSACLDVAKITCDRAVSVSDGFDACSSSVETLASADCEAIQTAVDDEREVTMPAACDGVIVNG